jgi:hypothetical protein
MMKKNTLSKILNRTKYKPIFTEENWLIEYPLDLTVPTIQQLLNKHFIDSSFNPFMIFKLNNNYEKSFVLTEKGLSIRLNNNSSPLFFDFDKLENVSFRNNNFYFYWQEEVISIEKDNLLPMWSNDYPMFAELLTVFFIFLKQGINKSKLAIQFLDNDNISWGNCKSKNDLTEDNKKSLMLYHKVTDLNEEIFLAIDKSFWKTLKETTIITNKGISIVNDIKELPQRINWSDIEDISFYKDYFIFSQKNNKPVIVSIKEFFGSLNSDIFNCQHLNSLQKLAALFKNN